MTKYFDLSGMCSSNGYGAVPLSWTEIEAFNAACALDLQAWEKRQIRSMSQVYCSVIHQAPDRSPYVRIFTQEEWETLGNIQLQGMEQSERKASEI